MIEPHWPGVAPPPPELELPPLVLPPEPPLVLPLLEPPLLPPAPEPPPELPPLVPPLLVPPSVALHVVNACWDGLHVEARADLVAASSVLPSMPHFVAW